MIENHMLYPWADDEPIPKPQEQDPDEAYEIYREDAALELEKTLKEIARSQDPRNIK